MFPAKSAAEPRRSPASPAKPPTAPPAPYARFPTREAAPDIADYAPPLIAPMASPNIPPSEPPPELPDDGVPPKRLLTAPSPAAAVSAIDVPRLPAILDAAFPIAPNIPEPEDGFEALPKPPIKSLALFNKPFAVAVVLLSMFEAAPAAVFTMLDAAFAVLLTRSLMPLFPSGFKTEFMVCEAVSPTLDPIFPIVSEAVFVKELARFAV